MRVRPEGTRPRAGVRIIVAVALAGAAVLSGCAAPVAGSGSQAPVPLGDTVFRARRPAAADCSRVDLARLGDLSAVSVPAGQAESKMVDSRADHVWASCVGRAATTKNADGTASGGDVLWLVSFATSPDATSDSQRMATRQTQSGYRTLIRQARLGDAEAQVVMDVHADDHETLLVVTVFDPRTGRAAARCGLAAARGDRADDAVNWCLKTLADQLLRPAGAGAGAGPLVVAASPSPETTPDAGAAATPGT